MSFLQVLQKFLLPFSYLYGGITDIRNYLYDKNRLPSVHFDIPTINIGNLTVGGTGKTPHIEYLLYWLKETYQIATLSRGYGRKTKGFRLATNEASAQSIGDEPMQFYEKFSPDVVVSVGEERILAVPQILHLFPETNLILLDDAYQHRAIRPDINILLTDYQRLFYKDFPFPAGRLRERRKQAKRADIIIVSKCPNFLKKEEQANISKQIAYYNANSPIFFSTFTYAEPKNIFSADYKFSFKQVILVSAIAQPKHFEEAVQKKVIVQEHFQFSDHHFFTEKDTEVIAKILEKDKNMGLICTEKDAVKLKNLINLHQFSTRIFSIAIRVSFLDATMEQDFQKNILEKIEQNKVL